MSDWYSDVEMGALAGASDLLRAERDQLVKQLAECEKRSEADRRAEIEMATEASARRGERDQLRADLELFKQYRANWEAACNDQQERAEKAESDLDELLAAVKAHMDDFDAGTWDRLLDISRKIEAHRG